ncbi:MAG: polymerase sigma-70 factor, subfamily [Mycobacterium sp.]|nr:polymerase sigma-70 factor, subfamily [Mycobacterium sp.]
MRSEQDDGEDTAVAGAFEDLAAPYRRELLAHCYRMLGSAHDAEDLVQETMIRAWRGYDSFDGRSSLRTWLYRIATNACLTALNSSSRRVLPSGLGAAVGDSTSADLAVVDSVPWLTPMPTYQVVERSDDPAAIVAVRDSTRLALIAAFQHLPARQRAVLLLIDVVGLRPAEAAQFLDLTYTATRSLLQRSRATLATDIPDHDAVPADPHLDQQVLQRYLDAFQAADTAAIASLVRDDIEYEMPPIRTWFRGRAALLDHLTLRVFTRLTRSIATSANGSPAMATYSRATDGTFVPHAIHVLETRGELISRIVVFRDTDLFGAFGLPATLDGAATA